MRQLSPRVNVCFLPRQESDKCFECNSQHRYDPYRHRNSHRIENVIYLMDSNGDNTWWQSVNGVCAFVLCVFTLSITVHKYTVSVFIVLIASVLHVYVCAEYVCS